MKKLFIAAALVLALTSCQTKNSAINDLRSLNQELQINSVNYTLNDWTRAGQDYYNINKRLTKHTGEYTNAELQEISRLNGQCVRTFSEGAVTKVNGATNMLKSFIDGLLK